MRSRNCVNPRRKLGVRQAVCGVKLKAEALAQVVHKDKSKNEVLRLAQWCLGCFAAVAAFSVAVSNWLTVPVCVGVLWPTDINSVLVDLLGGEISTNLAGTTEIELSWYSVYSRLAFFIVLLCFFGRFFLSGQNPRLVEKRIALFRDLTIVLGVSSLWWILWLVADLGFLRVGELALGLLPLWLMSTVAFSLWLVGQFFASVYQTVRSGKTSALSRTVTSKLPWLTLLFATIGWVGISFWLNQALYQQLMIPHGDSAMYEEHLWNVWNGKGFRSYLDQGLFLGEHIQVIHLLLLPFHFLWPSHLLLELSESIALGSCSLIVFAIAKRHSGSQIAAMWMGLAWLCYFPMHFLDIAIDQKTFRPIVLALPFLFGMIYYGEQGKFWPTAVCLLLALSAKEDVALVACPVLAVMAVVCRSEGAGTAEPSKAWKALLGLSVATAIYLLVTVLVIIPAFRSGEHVHYARYFGSLGNTPGELIRTALQDPLAVVAQALQVQTLIYIAVFVVPLALLPMRRPWVMSAGVVTFGMLSLLQFSTDSADLPPVPYHHFHAPLLPVVFWAAICALSKLGASSAESGEQSGTLKDGRFSAGEISALAFCCCLATAFTGSLSPLGATFWSETSSFGYRQLYKPSDQQRRGRAESIGAIVEQIPMSARVASTDYVHTRLTHHERSYDYSGYLRAVNNYQPGVPSDTDFIVLDLTHPYSSIRSADDVPELQQDESIWQLRKDLSNDYFLVLERRGSAATTDADP